MTTQINFQKALSQPPSPFQIKRTKPKFPVPHSNSSLSLASQKNRHCQFCIVIKALKITCGTQPKLLTNIVTRLEKVLGSGILSSKLMEYQVKFNKKQAPKKFISDNPEPNSYMEVSIFISWRPSKPILRQVKSGSDYF